MTRPLSNIKWDGQLFVRHYLHTMSYVGAAFQVARKHVQMDIEQT